MPHLQPLKFEPRMIRILCALLLTGLLGACAPGATRTEQGQTEKSSLLERSDQAFPLEKGIVAVEIDNAFGEINVRGHDRPEVGVHGVAQVPSAGMAQAKLIASHEGDTLKLVVSLPKDSVGGRYDLAAYVPKDMALILRGNVDRVDARKRAAPVKATSVSGDINASSSERLEISTQSGTVRATQLKDNWIGASHIRSDSGRITALVPLSGNLTLSAETGGQINNNFGLSVHPREGGGSRAGARYGSGSSVFEVRSNSGEVVLDQAVLLGEDT